MYTILMNKDKSLTTSVKRTIYEQEKGADNILFLLPQTYEDVSISDCTVVAKYVNSNDESHEVALTLEDELYSDRLQYVLPVDEEFTEYAGTNKLLLSFESGSDVIMRSGMVGIKVNADSRIPCGPPPKGNHPSGESDCDCDCDLDIATDEEVNEALDEVFDSDLDIATDEEVDEALDGIFGQ